jgi:hypothetical protein
MATGQGAHEAEVAYMIKMSMIDADVMMMNQLRYFRNGILYYGTALDAVYAKKIIKFTRKMYPLLSKFANVGWT